eukprot:298979-Pelagomonas_calceolata.AAC.2
MVLGCLGCGAEEGSSARTNTCLRLPLRSVREVIGVAGRTLALAATRDEVGASNISALEERLTERDCTNAGTSSTRHMFRARLIVVDGKCGPESFELELTAHSSPTVV